MYPSLPSGTAARYYCGVRRQASESQKVRAINEPIPKAIAILLCALLVVVTIHGDEAPSWPPADAANLSHEGNYSMTARIRPLLFWISRKNVGGGRISWTESESGITEIEMLIGSDPERAPRRIIESGFQTRNLATGGFAKFSITCGTEATAATVPVRIVYRPRWWFQVELALEGEMQPFPPGRHRLFRTSTSPALEAFIRLFICTLAKPVLYWPSATPESPLLL